MECLPVRSVNLGTGENGMHPDFQRILTFLKSQPAKLTITSNGHSIAILNDEDVRAFHDVEFSLDYPTEVEQDAATIPLPQCADRLPDLVDHMMYILITPFAGGEIAAQAVAET